MPRTLDVLDLAIESTVESFLRNPANYSDERALAEAVRSRSNAMLTPATVDAVAVEESSGARGDIPEHEAYTARYRKTTEIERAQCEIGGPAFPFGDRERLDLGVFSDGIEIRLTGGTQQFDPSDLAAGLEFKYVKNINYLRYRPDDEASKYRDISEDIERLGELPEHVERRCVVFGNYDMLRRDADADAEQGLRELAAETDVDLRFVFPDSLSNHS
jgi:hypothetical protein